MRWCWIVAACGCFSTPAPPPFACAVYSDWGPAAELVGVNSAIDNEFAPSMTADRLRLVFGRQDQTGVQTPYEATRPDRDSDFSPPTRLAIPNFYVDPWMSPDGLTVMFDTYDGRSADIGIATRDALGAAFTSSHPLAPFASGTSDEREIGMTPNLLHAVVGIGSTIDVPQSAELFLASRASRDQPFSDLAPIPELANPGNTDCCGTFSPDGLTLIYQADRGAAGFGLFEAHRQALDMPFQLLGRIPVFDDGGDYTDPRFTPDGLAILYTSRTTGASYNLTMRERTCLQ